MVVSQLESKVLSSDFKLSSGSKSTEIMQLTANIVILCFLFRIVLELLFYRGFSPAYNIIKIVKKK